VIISHSFFLGIEIVTEKTGGEIKKKVTSPPPPPPENRAVCETCKNIVELDTRSKYVIRIAFPLQECLHECSHCYVIVCIVVVDGAKRHAESVLRCALDYLA